MPIYEDDLDHQLLVITRKRKKKNASNANQTKLLRIHRSETTVNNARTRVGLLLEHGSQPMVEKNDEQRINMSDEHRNGTQFAPVGEEERKKEKRKEKHAGRQTWKCSKNNRPDDATRRRLPCKTTRERRSLAHSDVSYRAEQDS